MALFASNTGNVYILHGSKMFSGDVQSQKQYITNLVRSSLKSALTPKLFEICAHS